MNRIILFLIVCCLSNGVYAATKRIVSLAPFITQNLYLLGAKDDIVGCTQYCTIAENDHIPVVADAVNVNVERIVSLHPDIVIAGGLTHPRIIAAIKKMGIETIHWKQPLDFNEICGQLRTLGRITGKNDVAEKYIAESRERLAQIHKNLPAGEPLKIFMEIGTNPLFTALSNTFMHDYIVQLNARNIAGELKTGMVSKEFVLMQNPNVIIIVSMGVLGDEELNEWKKYPRLEAVKNNRIFICEQDELCSPTPVTFVDAVEKMAKLIYP